MGSKICVLLTICGILLGVAHLNSGKMDKQADEDLPMVYEYFRNSSSNVVGLVAEADGFKLNGKKLKIMSGAMHYFRIHPDLWRDRLKKLRAMGANTVETYVPWNLHEPKMGEFDFGNGTNDMSMFLDVRRYLQIAQEEDLLVLFRPGPYICTEWDFGGLPSWLQRDPEMKVRTNYQPYLDRVKIFFDKLLPHVADLQFTRNGPIIAIQIENEYGSFNAVSKEYLEFLLKLYVDHGFTNETLFFTSDGVGNGDRGTLPGLLYTANFQGDVDGQFGKLKELQPDKPVMAMEYWAGWFDHWFENHHVLRPGAFVDTLDGILGKWDGSVNLYMFHGGTNFGFMAGANTRGDAPFYDADVTSYDYDAPLSEAGDYTTKYSLGKSLFELYQEPRLKPTEMIPESVKRAYPSVNLQEYLTYDDIISQVPTTAKFTAQRPISMENLPMNDDSGQSYGYIIYRSNAEFSNGTNFEAGPVRDFGMLLIDSQLQPTGFQDDKYWINAIQNFSLSVGSAGNHVLDLLIENTARVNFGNDNHFLQEKGLVNGTYKLNGNDISDIEIIALEFKSAWVKGLSDWKPITNQTTLQAPVLLQTTFEITEEPADTFLDMSAWHKGIVFINGFNIGRYFRAGPQQTLYIPAPLLKQGTNTVTIFEQFEPSNQLIFKDVPNLGPLKKDTWKICKADEEIKGNELIESSNATSTN
ncbi:Beta-galactosidase-1-like protein 2 [Orchesella cincta]|uniref:Beta-galactosidase-1-like protein 2 n=1 Tax=Orchesella cincta TaxID=48709 RepID=A0A1D2N8H8_ORCCI|nr:Beta-galactosidase-1-like protein 2 [Orchesella cincta]